MNMMSVLLTNLTMGEVQKREEARDIKNSGKWWPETTHILED